MKERPILFNGAMVRAILDGSKTQTRRVVKLTDSGRVKETGSPRNWHLDDPNASLACPYGKPGDRLWVRETCRAEELPDGLDGVRYLADEAFIAIQSTGAAVDRWLELRDYGKRPSLVAPVKTVPSIHMPRWASRITLEVVGVRAERLRDISEEDARAEGARECDPVSGREVLLAGPSQRGSFRLHYRDIWEQINGPGSWDLNPWVWVVEFKQVPQ